MYSNGGLVSASFFLCFPLLGNLGFSVCRIPTLTVISLILSLNLIQNLPGTVPRILITLVPFPTTSLLRSGKLQLREVLLDLQAGTQKLARTSLQGIHNLILPSVFAVPSVNQQFPVSGKE